MRPLSLHRADRLQVRAQVQARVRAWGPGAGRPDRPRSETLENEAGARATGRAFGVEGKAEGKTLAEKARQPSPYRPSSWGESVKISCLSEALSGGFRAEKSAGFDGIDGLPRKTPLTSEHASTMCAEAPSVTRGAPVAAGLTAVARQSVRQFARQSACVPARLGDAATRRAGEGRLA